MSGARLALMVGVGLFLIMAGLTGKLGSMLGAIIDPSAMLGTGATTAITVGGPAEQGGSVGGPAEGGASIGKSG